MKASIRYTKEFMAGPLTPWVHKSEISRSGEKVFVPPLPKVKSQGFARYYVEGSGAEFVFSSLDELSACVRILSAKQLPHSLPSAHWLNRLPGWLKSFARRQRIVDDLEEARRQFLKREE